MTYSGMTVNERLWVSGLLEDFENAVKAKDIERIVKILEIVELTGDDTVKAILMFNDIEWKDDDLR